QKPKVREQAAPKPEPVTVLSPSYILSPQPNEDSGQEKQQMITVTLRSNGDKLRDALKIQRIYGIFVSYPGDDSFALYLFEGDQSFLIEFPNFTTKVCDEMLSRLHEFVPGENVYVESVPHRPRP
ncbi:MAG: hypothetical protein ACE5GO_12625, partial [Anaerolineales bacterium]